jgi:hypothetical protein
LTIIESVISLCILSLAVGGILAAMMQTRRLTEGSIAQNTALTIVQGYLEQLKNMNIGSTDTALTKDGALVNSLSNLTSPQPIRSLFSDATTDIITPSTGTPPALSTLVPGTTPKGVGIMDNLRSFDMAKDPTAKTETSADTTTGAATAQVPWTTQWPGAASYTGAASNGVLSATTGRTDLHLNLWVWIQDLSNVLTNAKNVYGITVIYTWQYSDGGRIRYAMGSVRTMRSIVPSY